MKTYKLVLEPVRSFFFHTNKIPPFRTVGVILYKLGLAISVQVLKRLPEIESIYHTTKFDESFVVGLSDIDVHIIIKDMPVEEEIKFVKKLSKRIIPIRSYLPFISVNMLLSNRKFKLFQKFIEHKIHKTNKSPRDWNLIYGEDSRINFKDSETQLHRPVILPNNLRASYEEVLSNIYEAKLNDETYFRRLYNYTLEIVRIFFILETKREAKDISEYKKFLGKKNIDSKFIDSFFDLPKRDFRCETDFLSLTLFCIIKLIEQLKTGHEQKENFNVIGADSFKIDLKPGVDNFVDKLDKKYIRSIYLYTAPYYDTEFYYLYLVTENSLDYKKFKQQFDSIFDNLRLLDEFRRRKRFNQSATTCHFYYEVYPLIMTETMMGIPEFTGGMNTFEPVEFNICGRKLFGENILANSDLMPFQNILISPRFNFGLPLIFLYPKIPKRLENTIDRVMYCRLFEEKNKLCFSNVREEYSKAFGSPNINLDDAEEVYKFVWEMLERYQDINSL